MTNCSLSCVFRKFSYWNSTESMSYGQFHAFKSIVVSFSFSKYDLLHLRKGSRWRGWRINVNQLKLIAQHQGLFISNVKYRLRDSDCIVNATWMKKNIIFGNFLSRGTIIVKIKKYVKCHETLYVDW